MTNAQFLSALQTEAESFAKAVANDEGEWIIKGFIDIYKNIYTISIDTKIVSKVLELLLFPMLTEFGKKHDLEPELSPQQNFYPDISFVHRPTGRKFAMDIKSTYRDSDTTVNGMTLGAFTGYFRNRTSTKNIRYPYDEYAGHFVLGVIYSQNQAAIDERKTYALADLEKIPSVIHSFQFFAQPKYRIATGRPGSGNTKNIGSCSKISDLVKGTGPFNQLGEDIYDDYWMYYLTKDMAKALEVRANASYFLIFRRFDGTVSEWDAFFRFSREAKMIKSAYCWVNSMSRQYPAMAFFNSLTSLLGT